MFKKFLIINIFFFIFTFSLAEEQKIVYLNVDKIMQQSTAGKSIKKQLENLYNKNLEKFKKNDQILKNKEKKIIEQKNILSKEDFQKELTGLRTEISLLVAPILNLFISSLAFTCSFWKLIISVLRPVSSF